MLGTILGISLFVVCDLHCIAFVFVFAVVIMAIFDDDNVISVFLAVYPSSFVTLHGI